MYLFFSTEAAGIPKSWDASVYDAPAWPRLLRLSWLLSDAGGQDLERQSLLIRPSGFRVPRHAELVLGLDAASLEAQGTDLRGALQAFSAVLGRSSLAVAYDLDLHAGILGAEYVRLGWQPPLQGGRSFSLRDWAQARGSASLDQLHRQLTGAPAPRRDDGSGEPEACKACYFKLRPDLL